MADLSFAPLVNYTPRQPLSSKKARRKSQPRSHVPHPSLINILLSFSALVTPPVLPHPSPSVSFRMHKAELPLSLTTRPASVSGRNFPSPLPSLICSSFEPRVMRIDLWRARAKLCRLDIVEEWKCSERARI